MGQGNHAVSLGREAQGEFRKIGYPALNRGFGAVAQSRAEGSSTTLGTFSLKKTGSRKGQRQGWGERPVNEQSGEDELSDPNPSIV